MSGATLIRNLPDELLGLKYAYPTQAARAMTREVRRRLTTMEPVLALLPPAAPPSALSPPSSGARWDWLLPSSPG